MKKLITVFVSFLFIVQSSFASVILIPMDLKQAQHLKAYGIAYWVLKHDITVDWMLNYRGGSFAFPYTKIFEDECVVRGVNYEVVPEAKYQSIIAEIQNPEVNQDIVKLEKAPKIAVYSPKNKLPWDDAVTMVLTYAEIPYDLVYDDDVMEGKLPLYDWLHLHHEDFTGQYGKFYAQFGTQQWFKDDEKVQEESAKKWGFQKVSQLKLAVAHNIRNYVAGGGFLFAMCSATDSYDIALAADGVDICGSVNDGDPMDAEAQKKLNFNNCFAFENFNIVTNPMEYEFSNIDATNPRPKMEDDYFNLFDFSAKYDPVPTMLCQDHTKTIKGFMGQTTDFREKFIKSDVLIMGEYKAFGMARYIHGNFGKGMWTYYGGHDPEDYQHRVEEPPTDLSLYPNSAGYRLILNNVLFPAAKKKHQKT